MEKMHYKVVPTRMVGGWAVTVAHGGSSVSKVNRPDEKLFTALARAAERRVSEFKPQDLFLTP